MWYGWIAKRLREFGVEISLRGFPDPLDAHEHVWSAFVEKELALRHTTLVIGHSSGAACALRLMEKHRFAGCVLVSAYDDDLGDELERESGYFNRPFNFHAMRENVPCIVQIHSASDHLVPVSVARGLAHRLESAGGEPRSFLYIETAEDGHFQDYRYDVPIWSAVARVLSP
jgi:predicted alpha/beta hydrolase family esterase